jgi:hypothetical protein
LSSPRDWHSMCSGPLPTELLSSIAYFPLTPRIPRRVGRRVAFHGAARVGRAWCGEVASTRLRPPAAAEFHGRSASAAEGSQLTPTRPQRGNPPPARRLRLSVHRESTAVRVSGYIAPLLRAINIAAFCSSARQSPRDVLFPSQLTSLWSAGTQASTSKSSFQQLKAPRGP